MRCEPEAALAEGSASRLESEAARLAEVAEGADRWALERVAQLVDCWKAALSLQLSQVAQRLVFLPAHSALVEMLSQARERRGSDVTSDLEVHVLRHEVEALRARDLLILRVAEVP